MCVYDVNVKCALISDVHVKFETIIAICGMRAAAGRGVCRGMLGQARQNVLDGDMLACAMRMHMILRNHVGNLAYSVADNVFGLC